MRDTLAHYWRGFQAELYEALEVELGALGERYEQLIQVFEFVRVEKFLRSDRVPGRPAKDRAALARPSRGSRYRAPPLAEPDVRALAHPVPLLAGSH